MSAETPDVVLPGWTVDGLRDYLQRADDADDPRDTLVEMAGYLGSALDRAVNRAEEGSPATALAEIGRLCRAMNTGTPGWYLRDAILSVLDESEARHSGGAL